jgi:hypothetical protein
MTNIHWNAPVARLFRDVRHAGRMAVHSAGRADCLRRPGAERTAIRAFARHPLRSRGPTVEHALSRRPSPEGSPTNALKKALSRQSSHWLPGPLALNRKRAVSGPFLIVHIRELLSGKALARFFEFVLKLPEGDAIGYLFLAGYAIARPRHRVKAFARDRLLALQANAISAIVDSVQGVCDFPQ